MLTGSAHTGDGLAAVTVALSLGSCTPEERSMHSHLAHHNVGSGDNGTPVTSRDSGVMLIAATSTSTVDVLAPGREVGGEMEENVTRYVSAAQSITKDAYDRLAAIYDDESGKEDSGDE